MDSITAFTIGWSLTLFKIETNYEISSQVRQKIRDWPIELKIHEESL